MHRQLAAAAVAALALLTACSASVPAPVVTGSTAAPPKTARATTGAGASQSPFPSATALPTTSASQSASQPTAATPAPSTGAARELPRGGTAIFPTYRLVGLCGAPGSAALGRLGVGSLTDRAADADRLATSYAAGRRPMPVLELIATVVTAGPGPDGMHRFRQSDETIGRYLAAARQVNGLLLLNIQPGRAEFVDEVRAYERWLLEPDVGVALDPEWAIQAGQTPGRVFGRTTGAELDAVAAYLSQLVAANRLPEKALVYHLLSPSILVNPAGLQPHPGVAAIVSVDGIGRPAAKTGTYTKVVGVTPAHVQRGFKLFYDEDAKAGPLMTPVQVLALVPQPAYVMYE